MQTRLTFVSPSRRLYVSGSVLSPQITVCLPICHTSPVLEKHGFSSSASTSKLSSSPSVSVSNKSAISISSKPVIPTSKPISCKDAISTFRSSLSHPASSDILLSARIYAFFCASDKCSTNTHGTSLMPSSFAAAILPCPARTLYSRSISTGLTKPNSLSDERNFVICSGECVRALFT